MSGARLTEKAIAPTGAIALLARDLLADFSDSLPDLTSAVVVLPNMHAAGALARALSEESGRALMLPKMTTLRVWAAEQPLPASKLPDVARDAELFVALRSRKWFDKADLWPLVAELAKLFDELTHYNVDLPDTVEAFERDLEKAYQASADEPMQFEARLVHELWHASSQGRDGSLGSAAIYQLQLARIAHDALRPLYAMGLRVPTPVERAFLNAYSRKAAVTAYKQHGNALQASLPSRFYTQVWSAEVPTDGNLRDRAIAFAAQNPASPVKENLSLYDASSLEEEASAVDAQVRLWLTEGRTRIAVVALDRLVARRVRALLERARVMVDDETGWTFSTTSASTVLMRWLDVVAGGFYYQDVLDLIKSPYIFRSWANRRKAGFELERVIRSKSVVAGLANFTSATESFDGDVACALDLLERLDLASRCVQMYRQLTLSDWMSQLFASLDALGVSEGLESDAAGSQLVDYLQRLGRDLTRSTGDYSFDEWHRWLGRQLESEEFRDAGVSSPVVFTQLSLTRLREFDAVVLTGCDAAHLPDTTTDGVFFNQSVRSQLGLPTAEETHAQIRDDLTGLLSRSSQTLITWQRLHDGEQNLLSPLFEQVIVFHELGWGDELTNTRLGPIAASSRVAAPVPAQLPDVTNAPAVAIPGNMVPQRVSASGYNSLLACPYQFYSRYVLGLQNPDIVREEFEKRDYGDYVHKILRQFHARFPSCRDVSRSALEAALREISETVFNKATQSSYLGRAWLMRWLSAVPAYLSWQISREEQGWRFLAAENKREIELELPGGAVLRLEGRIDRIDTRSTAGITENSVIDYKTQAYATLRRRLKAAGEDVQLIVYAQLLPDEVHEALYLSVDAGDAKEVLLDSQLLAEVAHSIERLRNVFARMRAGEPLRAQGIDAACQWCEMQGLCRKEYWP